MKIGICEDKKNIRYLIKSYVLEIEGTSLVTEYASGEMLLNALQKNEERPDILFLDISLNGEPDGMETAKRLREIYADENAASMSSLPLIIFVTGDAHRMPEAFRVHAFQYLVKPIDHRIFCDVFRQAKEELQKIIRADAKKDTGITIQSGGVTRRVLLKDILYIESSNRKVILHLAKESVDYYGRISELAQELDEKFFRIHRSFIVNMDFVQSYTRTVLKVRGGFDVPIAKAQYQDFVIAYMNYLSGGTV